MSQMRPIRETISLADARSIIDAAVKPITRVESIRVDAANQRVLASPVIAQADVPPFARAAMDGYAVRAADTFGASVHDPRILTSIETIYTGDVPVRSIGSGECAEIATGAPAPEGADAVVMVEETDGASRDQVRVFSPVYPGQNIAKQGADIRSGQRVFEPHTVLNPSRIGALAALGFVEVAVFCRPRVAILSTGNEIVEPGQPLKPGQIYDINRFTLASVIEEHGGTAVSLPTAADSLADLEHALANTRDYDLIVFSGGSSVGERDLILDVVEKMGEVKFHGIAVKPGKPTLFGVIGGTPILGMPGYPTSCLSNAYMLLVPPLRRLAHLPTASAHTVQVPLGQRVVSTTGRHQFYTVRLVDGVAWPAFKASGDITSMAQADGYIEIPAQIDVVEKGELVNVTLF
jgi:molybdopterin molybdotransferase